MKIVNKGKISDYLNDVLANDFKTDILPLFSYLSTKPYKHKNDVTKFLKISD